jgi:hypothetical protein
MSANELIIFNIERVTDEATVTLSLSVVRFPTDRRVGTITLSKETKVEVMPHVLQSYL